MISDLKDLKALFKICRIQGVTEIKLNGVEIKFGDMPQVQGSYQTESLSEDPVNPYANFPAGELSPEQLAFYSAGGHPDDDPANKEAI